MDGNTSSDRILKNLTDHFEKVGHDERPCLIRQLEGMLRRLICRNIREDVPSEVDCAWSKGIHMSDTALQKQEDGGTAAGTVGGHSVTVP